MSNAVFSLESVVCDLLIISAWVLLQDTFVTANCLMHDIVHYACERRNREGLTHTGTK